MIVLMHLGQCWKIGLGDETCVCMGVCAGLVGLVGAALAVWRAGR